MSSATSSSSSFEVSISSKLEDSTVSNSANLVG